MNWWKHGALVPRTQLHRGETCRPGGQAFFLIVACALAVALPLAIRGNSCGHDFDFHLQSWLAVAHQWQHGVFYPHWIEGANYAAGEPRLVFYPPLTWMFGALLGTLLPWSTAPFAFTLIVITGCGFSMYRLACEWLPPNAATLAACVYVFNPYALFVAYERTAYAELAAGIWLPLIVLYAFRRTNSDIVSGASERVKTESNGAESKNNLVILSGARSAESKDLLFQRSQPSASNIIPLALTIAAIWLTNAPAAVMSCHLLAAIVLWISITRRSWQPILTSAASLILGLGLASFYLVPAAYERRWVDIARAIGPGMRIQDSFLFEHTGESFHDHVLRTASWIFVTMFVTILILGWISWKRLVSRRWLMPLFATATVLFLLQLPWSQPLWNHAPELKFLQFPWRWSLVLSLVLAISVGAATILRHPAQPRQKFGLQTAFTLIAAICLVSAGTWFFWQPCDDEDAVSAQVALFKSGNGFEGTDEYTPLGADNSIIQQNLPQLRLLDDPNAETAVASSNQDDGNPQYIPSDKDHLTINARIEQWQPEHKSLTLSTQSPGFAILRLMDYPAWQVLSNGAKLTNRPHRDDGLMTIPIQPGTTLIVITYAATPDVWCGRALSAASLLAILALAFARRP